MITHDVYGGLGNQLFQIFTTIAISLKSGYSFFFTYKPAIIDQDTHRHTYWDSFLKKLDPFVVHADASNSFLSLERIDVKEPKNHEFFEIVPTHVTSLHLIREFSEDVIEVVYQLTGFFQSYKYFEHEFAEICQIIGLESQKHNLIQEIEEKGYIIAPISMHFRLGDYKKLEHIHPIMPFEYYRNSLTFVLDKLHDEMPYDTTSSCLRHHPQSLPFEERPTLGLLASKTTMPVLIFCEASDFPEIYQEVICRLEPLFPMCEFIRAPFDDVEWKHMLYMSLCRCNIIANSTFSLWGALFNSNTDAIICYPWHWYTDLFNKSVKDMFPSHWSGGRMPTNSGGRMPTNSGGRMPNTTNSEGGVWSEDRTPSTGGVWHKIGYIACDNTGEKSKHRV
jgi:hypothetical protein